MNMFNTGKNTYKEPFIFEYTELEEFLFNIIKFKKGSSNLVLPNFKPEVLKIAINSGWIVVHKRGWYVTHVGVQTFNIYYKRPSIIDWLQSSYTHAIFKRK